MKPIMYSLLFLLVSALLPGCYGLQDNDDYTPVRANPHLYMSAWEFIESRPDLFGYFKEAIEYVDEVYPGFKDYYTRQDRKYTHIMLTQDAFLGTTGLFYLNNVAYMDVTEIPAERMRKILSYMIIDGYYHGLDLSGSLSSTPIHVITMLEGPDGYMTMKIDEYPTRDRYSTIRINQNVQGRTERTMATSNLIATNGVIHVSKHYLFN